MSNNATCHSAIEATRPTRMQMLSFIEGRASGRSAPTPKFAGTCVPQCHGGCQAH